MIDINIKFDGHPNYDPNQLEVSSELDILIQGIELLLFTNKGEVIGEEDFGASLDEYLFQLNVSPEQIASKVQQDIYENISNAADYDISVNGTLYEQASDTIGVISVTINDKQQRNTLAEIEALVR